MGHYAGRYMETNAKNMERRQRLAAPPSCIPPVLCRCCRKGSVKLEMMDGIRLMVAWPSESPVAAEDVQSPE